MNYAAPLTPKRRRHRRGVGTTRHDAFALFGVAPSFRRLLRYFAVRPAARPHLRKLQRALGLGSASVQRDLGRLVDAGLLRPLRDPSERAVQYAVAPHPLWEVVRSLVRASGSPVDLLREALRDVAGVDAAWLFGSSASGTAHPDSDLDVLVVGDSVDTRALYRNLFEVGQVLDRQVNTLRYTRSSLAERLASGARFPRDVMAGPMIWLAGDPAIIVPIATAAGVPLRVEGHGADQS